MIWALSPSEELEYIVILAWWGFWFWREPGWTPHPVTGEVVTDRDSDFHPDNFEMAGPSNIPHFSPTLHP